MADNIREILKLGRIEFAGFLFCVMLTGLLSIQGPDIPVTDLLGLFAIAVLSNHWGFIHNDCCDIDIDRRSRDLNDRPLVRGTVSVSMAGKVTAFCIGLIFLISFFFQKGMPSYAVLGTSMVFGWGYNRLSKRLPGSDLIFAGSTALLCLFGALWGESTGGSALSHWRFAAVVIGIQFIDHIVFNAGATLKDVRNDADAGALTMAIFSGVRIQDDRLDIPVRFKAYLLGLRLLALSLALFLPAAGLPVFHWSTAVLLPVSVLSVWLLYSAVSLTVFDRRVIGKRWVKQEAVQKLVLPVVLIPVAGLGWCLFLIVFSTIWFFAWNRILYGKRLHLNQGF